MFENQIGSEDHQFENKRLRNYEMDFKMFHKQIKWKEYLDFFLFRATFHGTSLRCVSIHQPLIKPRGLAVTGTLGNFCQSIYIYISKSHVVSCVKQKREKSQTMIFQFKPQHLFTLDVFLFEP